MNEKERIIDLVRNNIISMDEALRLLEAAGKTNQAGDISQELKDKAEMDSSTETFDQTPKNFKPQSDKQSLPVDEMIDKGASAFKSLAEAGFSVVKEVAGAGVNAVKDLTEKNNKEVPLHKVEKDPVEPVNFSTEETTVEDDSVAHQEALEAKENEEKIEKECFEKARTSIDEQIELENEKLKSLREQELIIQQRIREFEILEELDEFTDEMQAQVDALYVEEDSIDHEIDACEEKLDQLYDEREELCEKYEDLCRSSEEFRTFIEDSATRIGEVASSIGKEASREGKKLGKQISNFIKSSIEQYTTKEVNVSFQVPWVKSAELRHTFTFPSQEIDRVQIKILNGQLICQSYDGEEIQVDAQFKRSGSAEDLTLEEVQAMATFETHDQQLSIHNPSQKLTSHLTVRLPKKAYQAISLSSLNGNISLTGLEANKIHFETKRGNLTLEKVKGQSISMESTMGNATIHQVTSDLIDCEMINGNIEVSESQIESLICETVNGNFRISDQVNQLKVTSVNGNCYVTKKNDQAGKMQVETTAGNIKISLPIGHAFELEGSTNAGKALHRVANLDMDEFKDHNKTLHIRRQVEGIECTNISAKTNAGNIYVKDNE